MKLKLEIDVPEYEWVDVPTLYSTPIGEFKDESDVLLVKQLIEYIQRLPDRHWIIEANHQHVRAPLCRELVRDRLRFIPANLIHYYGESLSDFLMDFQERTGRNFNDYVFTHHVLSNGKKIQFKTFSMMFDTEEEAFRHIVKIHTSKSDFEFAVDQGDQHGASTVSREDQSGSGQGGNELDEQGEKTNA